MGPPEHVFARRPVPCDGTAVFAVLPELLLQTALALAVAVALLGVTR